ncbi:uncharacterized protein LOC132753706 [Ruditapes philippinarum]|uniref:uncharacterized protein LOC132753706 n=1 Tax=Ruditapes philippinarum TaxID=129788 RepID=UPI00295A764E|nr:uncharacterized protein LOC132753706 [Ruditapes philippinarum]
MVMAVLKIILRGRNDAVEATQELDVGECQMIATTVEFWCCFRVTRISVKMEEHKIEIGCSLSCITADRGFSTVCLDSYKLRTAYFQYSHQYGEREEEVVNRRHIYTAYRPLATWFRGYLEKDVRMVLPSCDVVN